MAIDKMLRSWIIPLSPFFFVRAHTRGHHTRILRKCFHPMSTLYAALSADRARGGGGSCWYENTALVMVKSGPTGLPSLWPNRQLRETRPGPFTNVEVRAATYCTTVSLLLQTTRNSCWTRDSRVISGKTFQLKLINANVISIHRSHNCPLAINDNSISSETWPQ